MPLTQVDPGVDYDQVELTFSDYLPDSFRVAVVQISPASNGDDCRPSEYRDALVAALRAGIGGGR